MAGVKRPLAELFSPQTKISKKSSAPVVPLLPPESVRGMKLLDRSAFSGDHSIPFVRFPKIYGVRVSKFVQKGFSHDGRAVDSSKLNVSRKAGAFVLKNQGFRDDQAFEIFSTELNGTKLSSDGNPITHIVRPLHPDVIADQILLEAFRFALIDDLNSGADSQKLVTDDEISVRFATVTLSYDFWTAPQLIESILPTPGSGDEVLAGDAKDENCEDEKNDNDDDHDYQWNDESQPITSAAWSQIGHIIHLNLRKGALPYAACIGAILLDKIDRAKTVITKTHSIDTVFRTFAFKICAGEDNFVTECRADGLRFRLDFSKVYWNPRLQTEHLAVSKLLRQDDILFDPFAGIGPFALYAAKLAKIRVAANDLNPESVNWLRTNIALNKVASERILEITNIGAVEFIRTVASNHIIRCLGIVSSSSSNGDAIDSSPYEGTFHFVMNLPSTATQFLKAFQGFLPIEKSSLSTVQSISAKSRIRVHCYTFCPKMAPSYTDATSKKQQNRAFTESCARQQVISSLFDGCSTKVSPEFRELVQSSMTCHFVRTVAPNKEMVRVSVTLPFFVDKEQNVPSFVWETLS